jgi:hypothetical protein
MAEPATPAAARPAIWLGDFVNACVKLGAVEPHQRARIADLLALVPETDEAPPPSELPRPRLAAAPSRPPPSRVLQAPEEPPVLEPIEHPAPEGEIAGITLKREATVAPASVPAWVNAPIQLAPLSSARKYAFQPIVPRRFGRALVGAAASCWRDDGDPDTERLVHDLALGRPPSDLPRLPRRTVRLGLRLMIDAEACLQPFHRDVMALAATCLAVIGRANVEVLRFDRDPNIARGQDLVPRRRTSTQRPMLLLTDGGASLVPSRGRPLVAGWQEFLLDSKQRRSPLLVLMPYAPSRWPRWLRGERCLHWNEKLRPAPVQRIVRRDGRRT